MTILHPTKLFCALATVIQTLDSAIHWINHYPTHNSIVFHKLILILWIVIYPGDSAIQLLNNPGLLYIKISVQHS